MSRGILKPDFDMRINKYDTSVTPADRKLQETYYLCNEGSFLNPINDKIDEAIIKLNMTELAEDYENKQLDHLDGTDESIQASNKRSGYEGNSKFDYKKTILSVFKAIEDPYKIEIVGSEIDYEQNPSEPTKPQKTVEISDLAASEWQ